MACKAVPRRCRHSGEGSRGFAQTLRVHSANGSRACKADAKRARLGRQARRHRHQRGSAATGISAAAHHAGVGAEGRCARDVLGRGLGLGGRFGRRGPIRGRGVVGSNRGGGGGRGAMGVKMVCLKLVSVRPVAVPGMGPGCERRELNGDQEDRRPNHPQNCSGRSHAPLLPYGPSQGNNGRNCGKCMVAADQRSERPMTAISSAIFSR